MAKDLENLSKMVYPGRVIIIGKGPDGSLALVPHVEHLRNHV